MNNLKMERKDKTRFKAPMYSHTYKVTTIPESNDKGNWRGLKIVLDGVIDDSELFQAAKAFRDQIGSGQAAENYAAAEGQESDAEEDGM